MKAYRKNITGFFYKRFCEKHAKREKGFVLVLTLMMISLLSVLAVTSFELVISTMRITNNHKKYLEALYTADAGVEYTLCTLSNPVVSWSGLSWTNPSTLSTLNLNSTSLISSYRWDTFDSVNKKWTATKTDVGDTYTVTLTMNMTNNTLAVESTGTVSSFTKVIEAEIANYSTPKITLWREKEM